MKYHLIDFSLDVLPVHPTPLAEDLKGNGILENAKDAIFKLAEKAAKVLTGSKSDTDAYTDNMTDGATDEILMERCVYLKFHYVVVIKVYRCSSFRFG